MFKNCYEPYRIAQTLLSPSYPQRSSGFRPHPVSGGHVTGHGALQFSHGVRLEVPHQALVPISWGLHGLHGRCVHLAGMAGRQARTSCFRRSAFLGG